MRLLILGGTAFLGHAVAQQAVEVGAEVTCAARGRSGRVPGGARLIAVDRDHPDGLAGLAGLEFDAVVDVTSRPSWARAALASLGSRVDQWIQVSTGSVYADPATPGQRALDAPVLAPAPVEIDDPSDPQQYGPCNVACEQAVLAAVGPDRSFVCRAGLIVGPHDPSDRFTWWPVRLARGGPVLAPGDPGDAVQLIDVRDLAGWLVQAAAQRRRGVYDGVGAPITREQLITWTVAGIAGHPAVAADPAELIWRDQDFLLGHDVAAWMGPGSLPLWLPVPQYGGFMSRDVSASLDAGLTTRPLEQTAADTLDWWHTATGRRELGCGLSASREAQLLGEPVG